MSSSSKEIIIRTINYNDSDNYNEDKFEDSTESDVCIENHIFIIIGDYKYFPKKD